MEKAKSGISFDLISEHRKALLVCEITDTTSREFVNPSPS